MNNFKDFFESSNKYDHSCVMFNLPKTTTQEILKWSHKNIPNNLLYLKHKEGRVEDIHITVLYGIYTNSIKNIKKITDNFFPIKVELGTISKFENKEFDVIKIEIRHNKDLNTMNKKLKKLKHKSEYPDYIPHCTLAYVKKNSCNHLLGSEYFLGKKLFLTKLMFAPALGKQIRLPLCNVEAKHQ